MRRQDDANAPRQPATFPGQPPGYLGQQAGQPQVRQDVMDVFQAADVNHDGVISREEFQQALRNRLLEKLGRGEVTRGQPMPAAPSAVPMQYGAPPGVTAEPRIGSAPMTAPMTAPTLQGQPPGYPGQQAGQPQVRQEVMDVFQAADLNHDGVISRQEFQQALSHKLLDKLGRREVIRGQPVPASPMQYGAPPGAIAEPMAEPRVGSAPMTAPMTAQHPAPNANVVMAPPVQIPQVAPTQVIQRPQTPMTGQTTPIRKVAPIQLNLQPPVQPGIMMPQGVNPLQMMLQSQQMQSQQISEMKNEMAELKRMFAMTMQMQQQQMQQHAGHELQYQTPHSEPDNSQLLDPNMEQLPNGSGGAAPTPMQPYETPMQLLRAAPEYGEGGVDGMDQLQALDRSLGERPPPSVSCHQCGNVYAPDARFCRKCGAERPLDSCLNCGNIFAADAQFCRKCGQTRPNAPKVVLVQPQNGDMTFTGPQPAQNGSTEVPAQMPYSDQHGQYDPLGGTHAFNSIDQDSSAVPHVDYNDGFVDDGRYPEQNSFLDSQPRERQPDPYQSIEFPLPVRQPDAQQSGEFAVPPIYGGSSPSDPFLNTSHLDPPMASGRDRDLLLPLGGSARRRSGSGGTLPPGGLDEDGTRQPDPFRSLDWVPNNRLTSGTYNHPGNVAFTPGGGNVYDPSLLPVPSVNQAQRSRASQPAPWASGSLNFIKKDWHMDDNYIADESTSAQQEMFQESMAGSPIPALATAAGDKRGDGVCTVM